MARSGRARQTRARVPRIPHRRLRTGKEIQANALPAPASLGVGSLLEVKIYLVLRKQHIPFRTQVGFDGGSQLFGGQKADFVLAGYGGTNNTGTIVEALGPWHDLPGAQMRDDRKWQARRSEGWRVVTIRDAEAPDLAATERVLMDRLGQPIGED